MIPAQVVNAEVKSSIYGYFNNHYASFGPARISYSACCAECALASCKAFNSVTNRVCLVRLNDNFEDETP
jgi:hypothetical protein